MSSSGSLKVVIKVSLPTSPVTLGLTERVIKRCLPFTETQTKLMMCCDGPLFCQFPNGLSICLSFPSTPSGKLWNGLANKGEKTVKSGEQWGSACEEEDHCRLKMPLCSNMLMVQMSQSSFHIILVEYSISEHKTKNYIKRPCLEQWIEDASYTGNTAPSVWGCAFL